MDRGLASVASTISSRTVAITAYFFVEDLYNNDQEDLVPAFAKFYQLLLSKINEDLTRLAKNYERPKHPRLLEDFQKYISQASVEPYAIGLRHRFLKEGLRVLPQAQNKGPVSGVTEFKQTIVRGSRLRRHTNRSSLLLTTHSGTPSA